MVHLYAESSAQYLMLGDVLYYWILQYFTCMLNPMPNI